MADDRFDLSPYPETLPDNPKSIAMRERALLERWDCDIRRAARRRASAANRRGDENDLAQEARIRVLAAARRERPLSERYVRKVIANALHDAAAYRERQVGHVEPISDDLPARDVALADVHAVQAVSRWLTTLPPRLKEVFQVLYRDGHSQREAAAVLGVSQPRVAQLHQALLERGRVDLQPLAA